MTPDTTDSTELDPTTTDLIAALRWWNGMTEKEKVAAHRAIRALPGPTDAQALAEAVKLLSRDALMVENIDAVADACREFKIKPELFRAAIAKIGGAA